MTILVENAESGEYLTIASLWTKIPIDGKHFAKVIDAFDAAKKEAIGRFNVVGYITETKQFINLNHGRGRGLPETAAA